MARYLIKQVPEDFEVVEVPKLCLNPDGPYTYFLLKKKGYSTLSAIKAIVREIHVPAKCIGFAGNKDKQAITEQACSIRGDFQTSLSRIAISGIGIFPLGRGDQPLRLGDHLGNRFSITVREIQKSPQPLQQFINYFGPQRFSNNNTRIGHALVSRRYHEAISLICESSVRLADGLHAYYGEHPRDPIGCLRTLPKTLLMLYVHSYQSMLWNETVREYVSTLTASPPPLSTSLETVPLIGFDLSFRDPVLRDIVESILEREGIQPYHFIFRDMPELCAEGGERKMMVPVSNLMIGDLFPNTLGEGFQCNISFSLPPGSYATTFLDQLFNPVL